MADKYKTVQKEVTAIQYTFDTQKDIYIFLGMKDVTFSVKDRTLSAMVTGANGERLNVSKNDWVVKSSDGAVTIWMDSDFKKNFEKSEE